MLRALATILRPFAPRLSGLLRTAAMARRLQMRAPAPSPRVARVAGGDRLRDPAGLPASLAVSGDPLHVPSNSTEDTRCVGHFTHCGGRDHV